MGSQTLSSLPLSSVPALRFAPSAIPLWAGDTTASTAISVTSPRLRGVKATQLRRAARAALRHATRPIQGEVSITLIDDRRMRDLNARYRGKDLTTDVLSFPLSDGQHPEEPFGDIVISYETAQRQARSYGAPLRREIERLLVHGVLHLCGYDHHEPRQAARMHALTRKVLREVSG